MIGGVLTDSLRRRSNVELAVLVTWALRGLSGWVVALPLVSLLAGSGLGMLPQADRALFEPGGLWLLESLAKLGPALRASSGTELVLFLLASAALVVPHSLLFVAWAEPALPFRAALARAASRFFRCSAIGLLELGAGALALIAGAILSSAWSESVGAALGERARDGSALAVLALGVVGAAAIGVAGDAARAASLRALPVGFGAALRTAGGVLRANAATLAAGLLLFTGAGALGVALAARAVEWVDVGKAGAWRPVLAFGLHQAALLGLCWLQALWVARVARAEPAPPSLRRDSVPRADVDRAGRSAEPGGPSPDLAA